MDAQSGKKISNYSPLISYYGGKSNSVCPVNEFIVCEIFSRLPVKSLIRFKCVCKKWLLDLAKKDRYFIDLHFDRSKLRRSCFLLLSTYVDMCLLSAPFKEEGGVGSPQTQRPFSEHKFFRTREYILLSVVNGLICFIDKERHSVCIYNPATRELTPWFKSIIKQQDEVKFRNRVLNRNGKIIYTKEVLSWSQIAFGYDHVSREYKVMSVWITKRYENGNLINADNICEVLTVCGKQQEQNKPQWRKIDAAPPIALWKLPKAVYANGSIYRLHLLSNRSNDDTTTPKLVKFYIGNETFEVISLPNFIINDINRKYCIDTIEVDGYFCLLAKSVSGWSKNSSTEVNMYILYDDADCSSTYYWKKERFSLPPFDNWKPDRKYSILPVPGTDLLIIRHFDSLSFYYFNRKKKTLSNSKFQMPPCSDLFDRIHPSRIEFFTYIENILPLN